MESCNCKQTDCTAISHHITWFYFCIALLRALCIAKIGEFFNLTVFACWTLYFSFFLVVILCFFFLFGKRSWRFPSAKLLSMNLKDNILCLSFNVWSLKVNNALLYDMYFSCKTSLQKVFWQRSRSFSFSPFNPLSQITHDCSRRLQFTVYPIYCTLYVGQCTLHTVYIIYS